MSEEHGGQVGHAGTVVVVAVDAPATIELRSRVLRDGRAHEGFAEDGDATTIHLAAVDGDRVVGVATFVPRDDGWWQLRGMAVDTERQGRGIGRAILDEAETRLRALGASGVWANGRDTALGFYERAGWRVVGDGYDMTGRPHHRVERPFASRD